MGNAAPKCQTLSMLHILGKKWTVPIIESLYSPYRKIHFNDLRDSLHGITARNLSGSLKELCDAGFVRKASKGGGGIEHTEYSLTENGAVLKQFIRNAKSLGVSLYNINTSCVNRQCKDCSLFA